MENTTTELIKQKEYLTQDEISSFKKINEDTQELVIKFGQIEFQIQNLLLQKQKTVEELETAKAGELKYFQKLENKYGKISIDPNTGEITKF
jgi:hypothetical protein